MGKAAEEQGPDIGGVKCSWKQCAYGAFLPSRYFLRQAQRLKTSAREQEKVITAQNWNAQVFLQSEHPLASSETGIKKRKFLKRMKADFVFTISNKAKFWLWRAVGPVPPTCLHVSLKTPNRSSHRAAETFQSTSFYGVTITQTTDKVPKASFCLLGAGGGKGTEETKPITAKQSSWGEQNITNFACTQC